MARLTENFNEDEMRNSFVRFRNAIGLNKTQFASLLNISDKTIVYVESAKLSLSTSFVMNAYINLLNCYKVYKLRSKVESELEKFLNLLEKYILEFNLSGNVVVYNKVLYKLKNNNFEQKNIQYDKDEKLINSLIKLRKFLGLSQYDFSILIGYNTSTVNLIENGKKNITDFYVTSVYIVLKNIIEDLNFKEIYALNEFMNILDEYIKNSISHNENAIYNRAILKLGAYYDIEEIFKITDIDEKIEFLRKYLGLSPTDFKKLFCCNHYKSRIQNDSEEKLLCSIYVKINIWLSRFELAEDDKTVFKEVLNSIYNILSKKIIDEKGEFLDIIKSKITIIRDFTYEIPNIDDLRKCLIYLRKTLGLNQIKFSNLIGYSVGTVRNLEEGKVPINTSFLINIYIVISIVVKELATYCNVFNIKYVLQNLEEFIFNKICQFDKEILDN